MQLVPLVGAVEPILNLAENQVAWQTSTGWGGDASWAVDGGLSTYFVDGSCSHTAEEDAVLGVKMESVSDIYFVEVLNRNQGNGQLINGYLVTEIIDNNIELFSNIYIYDSEDILL